MPSASRSPTTPLLLLLILQHYVLPSATQQIYIDNVPEYSSLTACAQYPVSSIVRDQFSGCGDNGALTSYSCFCYASSAAFASIISTAVVENCTQPTPTPQLEASSAVDVFSSYCQLGAQLGFPNPTATGTSASATKASGSATSTNASTSNTADHSSGGLSTGAGIGVGIVIGLFCASLAFGLFLLRRRSKQRRQLATTKDDTKLEEKHDQPHKEDEKARPSYPSGWTSEDTMATELPLSTNKPLPELSAKDRASHGYELP